MKTRDHYIRTAGVESLTKSLRSHGGDMKIRTNQRFLTMVYPPNHWIIYYDGLCGRFNINLFVLIVAYVLEFRDIQITNCQRKTSVSSICFYYFCDTIELNVKQLTPHFAITIFLGCSDWICFRSIYRLLRWEHEKYVYLFACLPICRDAFASYYLSIFFCEEKKNCV